MLRTIATPIASALSVMMATNGSATRVTSEPKIEIVAADQTRWNATLLHSDFVGSSSGGGKVGSRRGSAKARGYAKPRG